MWGGLSLTREWFCNLLVQLLLGLAIIVTPGSMSHGTCDHILLSHLRFPTWRAGWPNYTSVHWVPFLSPLMTYRVMVEIF
jgi:hypothetical protein